MAKTHKIAFSTGRVIQRNRLVTSKAYKHVARKMQAVLRKAIGRQGPPRSRQGNPPKKDSGELHASVKVKAVGRKITLSMNQYGMFLDNEGKGFRHHHSGKRVIRPWYTPKIFKGDARRSWERELNKAMRRFSK